ncbi:MAG TPA: family 16 glycoside hydrolase [Terracidiphilus sp.]|nr:family 16 glycoside hydrolase [Terracidiphilus sp.]
MPTLTRRDALALLLAAPAAIHSLPGQSAEGISLFDGTSLRGWRARGHANTFKAADGQIAVRGENARLFFIGSSGQTDFKNFEFSAEVMMQPGAESAVCFHTKDRPVTSSAPGFQVLLANDSSGPHGFIQRRKTGSLFGVRHVWKQYIRDNEWFTLNILVRQKQIQVRVNDMLVVDYVEPADAFSANAGFDCRTGHGTFALQALSPQGATFFRNLRVRPLPDAVPQLSDERPQVDDVYRDIIRLGAANIPVVDYHTHLKGGLTLDQALANSRRVGIGYGIAINCGLSFPVHDDASIRVYLESMKGQPCFVAMQAEGREWRTLVTPESVARFDYVFTDAMTFSDDNGKRMRIWIPEEIGVITDKQAFMEMLVKRIEGVMREPIDIYANATYIPDQIAADYDALWTRERMQRVIDAALRNEVAIEINNRRKIPSPAFLKMAKAAGCKFSFGTNNAEAELGRLEYPIQMVKECGLVWQDIFVPKPDGQKPIQLRPAP